MSNGTKVKKRDGSIESLDLDKMHLSRRSDGVLQGSLRVK